MLPRRLLGSACVNVHLQEAPINCISSQRARASKSGRERLCLFAKERKRESKKERGKKEREKERKAKHNNQHKQPPCSTWPTAGDHFQDILVHGVSALLQPEPPPANGFVSLCKAVATQRAMQGTTPSKPVPVTTRAAGGCAMLPFGSTLGVWGCLTGWVPIDPFPSLLFVGDRSKAVKLKRAGTAPHRSRQPRTGPIHGAPRSHDLSPSVDTRVQLCPLLAQVQRGETNGWGDARFRAATSERRPNKQGAAELNSREVYREHLSPGGGWAKAPAPCSQPGCKTGQFLPAPLQRCSCASIALCLAGAGSCRRGLNPKTPRIRGCSSALDQLLLQRGHVSACSGALGDPTGGFLSRAEAVPRTARREGQILPCRLTLHEPEDRKI